MGRPEMKVFAYTKKRNVGDALTSRLVAFVRPDVKQTLIESEDHTGKLVGVGSILCNVRPHDTVWGTGAMFQTDALPAARSVNVLAVRGDLTAGIIERSGGARPSVTGDPAVLVPLMIPPAGEKRFKVGYIPHFVDYAAVGRNFGWDPQRCLIDVFSPLEVIIGLVTQCERIEASSLHGLIIAEAYGIPVRWVVYSNKIRGSGFKFRDYLTGTGRAPQPPGFFPPIPDLAGIQRGLISALQRW